MSDDRRMAEEEPVAVADISAWVERARPDPEAYLERQATEVFLTAVGISEAYRRDVYLKGGVLMGIRYGSPRQTADLDFSTSLDPNRTETEQIRADFDIALTRASARLGYPDLICRVQTIKPRPSAGKFATASFPALALTIAYARRESAQAGRLADGQCPTVLDIDISFNEFVDGLQIIRLGAEGADILAYSLNDLMAEKLRSMLQQVARNRYRRQDVYDLALLIEQLTFDDGEKARLLDTFLKKCRSRHISPDRNAISDPEVVRRARSEWATLELELPELPDFDERFGIVDRFYRSLPWTSP